MKKSKIFLKTMFILSNIILVYSIAIYFVILPRINQDIQTLEEQKAKEILNKIETLTNNVYKDLESYKKLTLQKHKDELRHLTDTVWSIIQLKYEQSKPENIGDILKQNADEFKSNMMKFYNENKDHMTPQELRSAIINYVNLHRYNNNSGYFFILKDTRVILQPIKPSLDGKDLKSLKDKNGVYFIREFAKISKEKGSGIASYRWVNPSTKRTEDKISYIFTFEPFNWIIGTGEYYNTLKEKLQNEVIDLVSKLRYDGNNYFYISDYSSKLISHPYLQGSDFSKITDEKGTLIVPPMVEVARKNKEGFHSYWWKKNQQDDTPYEKLTFSKDFPNWNMVIGTGVYIDDIDKEMKRRKKELTSQLQTIINSTKIAQNGYVFIFDKNKKVLISPKNISLDTLPAPYFDKLIEKSKSSSQELLFTWNKENNRKEYETISWVKHIPKLDWYVVSFSYMEEFQIASKKISDFLLIFTLLMLIFTTLYGYLFFKKLLTPIWELSKLSQKVIEGDYSIRSKKRKGDDEISLLSHSFNKMLDTIADHIHHLDQKVQEKTLDLQNSNNKIHNLLNNAGEGFLSFSSNMLIDPAYSIECERLLGDTISHKDISGLLFNKKEDQELFINMIQEILSKQTPKRKRKVLINLLQKEFLIGDKNIEIAYKVLENNTMMLILDDVTQKKLLQQKLEKEKKTLKMVVTTVQNMDNFLEQIEDYKEFIATKEIYLDKTKTVLYSVSELFRKIHTFKGNFAQIDMVNVVHALHKFESTLNEMVKTPTTTFEELKNALDQDFNQWIKDDLDILTQVLGEEFLHQDPKYHISEKEIEQLEEKANTLLKSDLNKDKEKSQILIESIHHLKTIPLCDLLAIYPQTLEKLSLRFNKSIYPLKLIKDTDIRVYKNYKPFIKSLIHIFRNSIDHGIESIDRRIALQKDEKGTISLTAKVEKNTLYLTIADDGSGLDIEKLKQKAVEKNIYTKQEIEKLSKEECFMLIFENTLSTKENITEISGRGVGMSALKESLDDLHGLVFINSEKDKGTTFNFEIPLHS